MTTLSEAIARLDALRPKNDGALPPDRNAWSLLSYRFADGVTVDSVAIIRQQQRMIEAARGALDILYTQSCACITNNYSAWEDTLRETRDRSKETLRALSPDQPLEDL